VTAKPIVAITAKVDLSPAFLAKVNEVKAVPALTASQQVSTASVVSAKAKAMWDATAPTVTAATYPVAVTHVDDVPKSGTP
jgi:hypothetical protein